MSKTQLQTNNEKLAALITELEGKAAGGGSAVETCTVTVEIDMAIFAGTLYIAYTGPDGVAEVSYESSKDLTETITVINNSVIHIQGVYYESCTTTTTNARLLSYLGICGAFEVTGDATIGFQA